MGKKPKEREWSHTRDELLALAVQKCNELGRMPSRRAWNHDGFFDFEELVWVLGKGSWERAELMIQFTWDQQRRETEAEAKAVEAEERQEAEAIQVEPEVKAEVIVEATEAAAVESGAMTAERVGAMENYCQAAAVESEAMTAAEPKRGGRGRRYALEEAIDAWREVCETLGTKSPTQQQINQLAREAKTPAYGTFLRLFGPRSEWAQYLEEGATEVAPEVCEVAVKDVLVKSLEMEVEIDGQPTRLRLRFGARGE